MGSALYKFHPSVGNEVTYGPPVREVVPLVRSSLGCGGVYRRALEYDRGLQILALRERS